MSQHRLEEFVRLFYFVHTSETVGFLYLTIRKLSNPIRMQTRIAVKGVFPSFVRPMVFLILGLFVFRASTKSVRLDTYKAEFLAKPY